MLLVVILQLLHLGLHNTAGGDRLAFTVLLALNTMLIILLGFERYRHRGRQKRLLEVEQRYDALFQGANDGIFIIGFDGTYHEMNRRAAQMLGYEVEEMQGRHMSEFIMPSERPASRQTLESLRYQRNIPVYRRVLQHKDGHEVPVEVNVAVVEGQDRAYIQSVVRDISSQLMVQRQMQLVQQVNEELGYTLTMQVVVQYVLDAAVRQSEAGSCLLLKVDSTTQALTPLGHYGTPTLLPIQPVTSEILHREPQFALIRHAMERQTVVSSADHRIAVLPLVIHEMLNGLLVLEQIPYPLANERYAFLQYLASRTAVALDNVFTHQQMQQYLEQLSGLYHFSQQLAASVEHATIYQESVTSAVQLLKCTCACLLLYDRQAQRLSLGSQLSSVHDEKYAEILMLHLRQFTGLWSPLQAGRTLHLAQTGSLAPDLKAWLGQLGLNALLLLPILHEDRFMGVLCVGETQQKDFSERETQLAQQLTIQTSIALHRASIIGDLRRAQQVKSEMLRMASHDLRNPMSQIRGFMELLSPYLPADDKARIYSENIQRAIDRAELLLSDILSLERIESHQPDTWHTLNLSLVVQSATRDFSLQMSQKKQQLQVELPQALLTVLGNDVQLWQAVSNLLSNAIKYTPEGGDIRVRVSQQGQRGVIAVTDNGYGVPAEQQAKLFQHFFRAKVPGTEHIAGTGLGLSLVKSIITRHGGDVFFESHYQKGSTFGFWLPLVTEKEH